MNYTEENLKEIEEYYKKEAFFDVVMNNIYGKSVVEIPEFKQLLELAEKIVDETTPPTYFNSPHASYKSKEALINHLCTIKQFFIGNSDMGAHYSPALPILVNDYKIKGERWKLWKKCFNEYFNRLYTNKI